MFTDIDYNTKMGKSLKMLEAYDKDNDVYVKITESDNLQLLKNIGIALWKNFNLSRKDNREPIDWLQISDSNTEQRICFLDEKDNKLFWMAS